MTTEYLTNLIHYKIQGEGVPVILIHGLGASLYDWEALMPVLTSAGYQSFAIDLLGHGESAKPDDDEFYTAPALIATFEDWLESLGIEAPYILIGHSLGGYISMRFSLRNPELVKALILIDPLYSLNQLSPILRYLNRRPDLGIRALKRIPQSVIDTVLGWDAIKISYFTVRAREQIALDIKRASPHILNIPATIADLTPELPHFHFPAQVIWGNQDLTLRPDSFPRMVEAMPNASGHEISGCGHQPHIGHPGQVNQLILDYLGQVAAPVRP